MVRYGMVIDLKRCIGCQSCTVTCKQENGTPRGIFYTKTLVKEEGKFPNVTRTFLPVLCNHCEEAVCKKVCPTGATDQREDGIVIVDNDKCVGCRACYVACPYKNRYYLPKDDRLKKGYFGTLTPFEEMKYRNFKEGTVVKCTFCHERVDRGMNPACVDVCPTDARKFGDLDDPSSEVSVLLSERNHFQLLPEMGTKPCVYYLP